MQAVRRIGHDEANESSVESFLVFELSTNPLWLILTALSGKRCTRERSSIIGTPYSSEKSLLNSTKALPATSLRSRKLVLLIEIL